MPPSPPGLHHVTAVATDAHACRAFYTEVLGLRLVKRTVNFDDPEMWHLYFGDELGRPGTVLTLFPISGAPPGRVGAGTARATTFLAGPGAVEAWMERLADLGLPFGAPEERFGERVLPLEDPDGLPLEIVERDLPEDFPGWPGGPVPAAHALRTVDGVTLALADPAPTARFLVEVFGYVMTGEQEGRLRLEAPSGTHARRVDLVPAGGPARRGAGTVHHVAFRARSDEELVGWQAAVRAFGLEATDVRDRRYFRSIYFREPGGVLFEIATDEPGFTADEPPETLGSDLRLPPWLEARRADILQRLPPLT